jgi:hypothetical protein
MASALAACASSSASSSWAMARSMRSELGPNFPRRSLASVQLRDGELSDDEAVPGRDQLGVFSNQRRVLRDQQLLQLGDVVGELIGHERHAG